jgi:hypothetical protein
MKYIVNEDISVWFKGKERKGFYVTFFGIIVSIFITFSVTLTADRYDNNKFIFGLIGNVGLIIFFLYAYFNAAIISNNTINEIEISETKIIIKTFSYNIMNFYTMKEKEIAMDSFTLLLTEYPLKDPKGVIIRNCYELKIGDSVFYLLYKYFDSDLIDVLNNRMKVG